QEPHSSTVFKTAAIDHSAISPGTKVQRISYFTKYFLPFLSKSNLLQFLCPQNTFNMYNFQKNVYLCIGT
ncbi:MAG: hypothetical protein RR298_06600, partial [Alistipes sp.]